MQTSPTVKPQLLTVFGLGAMPVLGGAAAIVGAQTPVFYSTGPGSHDVVAADVNRNGAMDLVVASSEGTISIRLNDGAGGFPDLITLDSGGGSYIDAGDIDGDYDADLVTAKGSTINVLLNDGQGGFSAPDSFPTPRRVHGVELVDVNGDGLLDLALSENNGSSAMFEVYLSDGTGSFTFGASKSFSSENPSPFGVTSGDFDGDGDQDVVTLNQGYGAGKNYYGAHVQVMLNDGDGTSWTHRLQIFDQGDFVGIPSRLRSGDLDRDGDLDLIYNDGGEPYGKSAAVQFLTNDGDGRFSELLAWIPSFDYTTGVNTGDVNGNGSLDVVAVADVGSEYRAYVFLDLGRHWSAGSDPEHRGTLDVENPDLDGDGMRDIVALVTQPEPGVLVTLNGYIPNRPAMSQTDLIRGASTTFTVSDANANEVVYFLYSLTGVDSSPGIEPLGFISIDLAAPIVQFASARADGSGVAEVSVTVPPQAPLGAVLATQAVIRRGPDGSNSVKTNFITAPIRD